MAKATTLQTPEDLAWLHDVHGIPTDGVAVAILYGNEDWPLKVETYAQDDYRCVPKVYRPNADGNFEE